MYIFCRLCNSPVEDSSSLLCNRCFKMLNENLCVPYEPFSKGLNYKLDFDISRLHLWNANFPVNIYMEVNG